MKEFALVGRPNSGKTLFALNFAGFLGCRTVDITFRAYDGTLNCRHFSLVEAKRELCGQGAHKTRAVQSLTLKAPVGKTGVSFRLTDTCGITGEIHGEEAIRRGMAQTMSLIRSTDFIMHVIDLSAGADKPPAGGDDIDREIYGYGVARGKYIILANKADLAGAGENAARLRAAFDRAAVLEVSALYSQGFGAVKTFVVNNL